MSRSSWNDIPSELQDRVIAGDPAALGPLAAWMHRHRPLRIDDDLVQKVMVTLCRLMGSERGQSLLGAIRSLPAFLAAVASRHRVDEYRAERRLRDAVRDASRGGPATTPEGDAVAILSRAETRAAIRQAFEMLSPLERDALERAIVLGESYHAIALSLLRRPPGVKDVERLRKLIRRARSRLGSSPAIRGLR